MVLGEYWLINKAAEAGKSPAFGFGGAKYGYQPGELLREMIRESARGEALSNLPAKVITDSFKQGMIDAQPAISDSTARGTLAGLFAVTDAAKFVLASWFRDAAAAGSLSGIGGATIQNASFGGFGGGGGGGGGSFGIRSGGGRFNGLGGLIPAPIGGLGGLNIRGVMNMNPGNIAYGAWAAAHGATGWSGRDSGHGVAVFPSFETGLAAMGALALGKYSSGARSIDALIAGAGGWTPGNHVAAANVARMMGISPFVDANLRDPATMARFQDALSVQELGPRGAAEVRRRLHPETHVHLYMDGKQVASAVLNHITDGAGAFPRQAPAHNRRRFHTAPDAGLALA